MITIECEYTDTFCGEPNYCWVKRASVSISKDTKKSLKVSRREIMCKGKAALGLTNVRGTVEDCGDSITFRPYRSNTIAFFTFK